MTFRYSGLTMEGDYKRGMVVALSEVDALLKIKENHGIRLVMSMEETSQNKIIQSILNAKDNQEMKARKLIKDSAKKQAEKRNFPTFAISDFFNKLREDAKERTSQLPKINLLDALKRNQPIKPPKEEAKEILSIFNSIAFEELKREKEERIERDGLRLSIEEQQQKEIDWELIARRQENIQKSGNKKQKIRVNKQDILLFTKRLQIMLSSGVTLVNALKVLSNGKSKRGISTMISQLIESLESGNTLSESLALFPKQFDPLYVSLIAIGEDSGNMSSVLLDIIVSKERDYKISKKISSAMVYPALMGFVLLGIIVLGSLFFIPAFKDMFDSQGMPLPLLTSVVFAIANRMPLIVGGGVGASILLGIISKKVPVIGRKIKRVTDKIMLHIPIINKVQHYSNMHNFAATVSMMLRNGIKLRDSLGMASQTIRNVYINEEISLISRMMTEGLTLSESLSQQRYFDEIITNIALTGEESGNMSFALGEAGAYYKNELEKAIETALEFIEPVSILLMAAIIVPVIIAVYLPILEISSGGTMGL